MSWGWQKGDVLLSQLFFRVIIVMEIFTAYNCSECSAVCCCFNKHGYR